jgi:hypothetical protein
MKLALVRIADDAPDPDGLIGWPEVRAPRRYAFVDSPVAWARWVLQHFPDQTTVLVDPDFTRKVQEEFAQTGHVVLTTGELAIPTGLRARTDGDARLHVTGGRITWESPVDTEETAS